jgi:hypothetical protein
MAKRRAQSNSASPVGRRTPGNRYRGKQARTGNSLGLRFERALFASHPEFMGEVEAHVIAPGRMLVVADSSPQKRTEEDPVLASFLGFLSGDMRAHPERIAPVNASQMKRIGKLVRGVKTSAEEDLGDEALR